MVRLIDAIAQKITRWGQNLPADSANALQIDPQEINLQQIDPRQRVTEDSFSFQWLLSAIAIGITTGALGILFDLSFAALIFSNSLSGYLSAGIGFILFSAAATRIAVGLMSSFPGMVADLAGIPTAILAWSTGMVIRQMPTTVSSAELLITVIVTIALTSALTGILLWLLGALRLGSVVRMLPEVAIGGFIASSGWLLVKGAFEVFTDAILTGISPWGIFQTLVALDPMQWVPGLLLALYLMVVARRYPQFWVMPSSLAAAIGIFYGVLALMGTSATAANAQGLTLGIPPLQNTWQLLSWSDLSQIHWDAIASQWMCSGTVSVMAAVLLLMNVKGLEVVLAKEIDINHELKVAGSSNILMGLGGGILSFQSFGRSVMAYNMGGQSRLVTLVGGATFIGLPLLFSSWFTYFPTTLLGGMLLYLGLSALYEWSYKAYRKLSRIDYALVQLTWLVCAVVGFLQALALGWAIAVILMVYKATTSPKLH
ncbi:MAG: SulP family inorganic anion transporter [Cyanobacteria bacterium J06634_6]